MKPTSFEPPDKKSSFQSLLISQTTEKDFVIDRSSYSSKFSGAGDMYFSESTANIYFSESTAIGPLDEMEFENDAEATLTASASTAASISDLNTNAAPGPVGTRAQVAIGCPG
jgi:hypothetical protein